MEEFAIWGLGLAVLLAVFIGIILLPTIFYLLTLQKTLEEVSQENALMPPGQVWLILIPVFGAIWSFIVVERIANSLEAEFAQRGMEIAEKRPGYSIGMAYCVLNILFFVPLAGIAGIVCWIIYWVKVNDYKTMLSQERIARKKAE